MNQRVTLLVLGILMLSYAPSMGFGSDSTTNNSEGLNTGLDRVEISPDPNSIRDLGQPTIYDGMEDVREVTCLLYTSPSPRDRTRSRMPSSA